MAVIDARNQFIALSESRVELSDDCHTGLVVDGKRAVRWAPWAGVEILPGRGLNFLDPWGNRWQVVEYAEIQFTKRPRC